MIYRKLSKLLLLGCSQCKKTDEGLLPAIDRYDGPVFRLLRRYLRQETNSSINVKILSAKYGLISDDQLLPYYDYRITKAQSESLHDRIVEKLETVVNSKPYSKLLICLGKDYLDAIYGYEAIIPNELTVQIATGGIGRKLSILHDWLYGDSSNFLKEQSSAFTKDKPRIRGVEVNLTSEEVLDIARQGIVAKDPKATCYQSWYVQVDDQRVAPKWLVSQITGLTVGKFVTDEARKFLSKLGIKVERV